MKAHHSPSTRPAQGWWAALYFEKVRYAWWKLMGLLTRANGPHAIKELWAVTCTRGEGPYIAEWVEYHLERGGIDGIYAIDNDPQGTPELQALQPKYGDRLVIARDAEEFANHLGHPRVLHRHFTRMKRAGRWIISLDSDEFAVPRDGERAVIDPPRLRKILEGYAQAGHPAAGFPTLNYAEADPNLFAQTGRLLASSTRRAPLRELHVETLQVYRSYKCAFHSNDYLGMVNPHTPLMLGGAPPTMHLERDLWLHHYFFRDAAFGQKKRERRRLLNIPIDGEHEANLRKISQKEQDVPL